MKFSVNQIYMNSAIQIISKIAGAKTVSKTQNAMLLIAKDSKIHLVACDGKNKIETQVEAKIQKEGTVLLPHQYIQDLIKRMPTTDIHFELEDSGNMIISAGKSKYKIMSYHSGDYQLIEMEAEDNLIELNSVELNRSIDQVKFAVSKDENRLILTGVLFEFNHGSLKFVAIDGYRMTSKEIVISSDIIHKMVITEKALSEVQRLISSENPETISMSFNEKMAKFTIGNTVFITGLLNGEFIHYENIIPKEFKSEMILSKTEFEQAVDRSMIIISANQNKVIKLKINDDVLQITTDSESGNAEEEVQIKLEGEDQFIGFNPRFILDTLKVIEGEELLVKFTNAKGPCIIKTTEQDNYFCLLLPCTI